MDSKNTQRKTSVGRKTKVWFFISGAVVCLLLLVSANKLIKYTSTDEFCMVCHIHPHAEQAWKLSTHHNNSSGTIVHCTQCHMPPEGEGYVFAKAKHGLKDAYSYFFKDSASIDWEKKKLLENAKKFVYEKSCLECHENLYPVTLSVNGGNAHLQYETSTEPINCINCHLNVGHYDKEAALHAQDSTFGITVTSTEPPYESAAVVNEFSDFTETLPGTRVSFDMIALPGGTFNMGSPEDEPFREPDEGPVRKVTVSPFWMAKVEVTWDEYLAFFRATGSQGRTEGKTVSGQKTDAISGATPPWGAPDQGWGKGSRPAITMSWHAASVYCRWLSQVTGKKYRLPTEAEWEYAARGGKSKSPFKYSGGDIADDVAWYRENSYNENVGRITTWPIGLKTPNVLMIYDMSGNVHEWCSDMYSAYTSQAKTNPFVSVGTERVIRGGSFFSIERLVRVADREKLDPTYKRDGVGFRIAITAE